MVKAAQPFGIVLRKDAGAQPKTLRFSRSVDAVIAAVQYLRRGYWVRLTDATLADLDSSGALDLSWMSGQARAAGDG